MSNNDIFDNKEEKCSFCGRTSKEVGYIITGSGAQICNECVNLCQELIKARIADIHKEDNTNLVSNLPIPEKIKEYLDDYVVGQYDAKKTLSVAVYNHYKRIYANNMSPDYVPIKKSNVLMLGPTGSGKTLLAESLAKFLDVPFSIIDSTTLTEAGYVGEDVSKLLINLLENAKWDIDKAEKGIIYIDEIDKKKKSATVNRDVSGEGVQQGLLSMIEGNTYDIPFPSNKDTPSEGKKIKFNTKDVLFIFGGAFEDIEKIISDRINKNVIGFNSPTSEAKNEKNSWSYLKNQLELCDLKKFGLIKELLGRLPIIVTLDNLTESDLIKVLTEPKDSIINQFKQSFKLDGFNLIFDKDALSFIAKVAIDNNSGARGLRGIIEQVLEDYQYKIPGQRDKEEKDIYISKSYVEERLKKKHPNKISAQA